MPTCLQHEADSHVACVPVPLWGVADDGAVGARLGPGRGSEDREVSSPMIQAIHSGVFYTFLLQSTVRNGFGIT